MSLHTSFSTDEENVVRDGREASQERTGDMASRTKEEAVDKQINEIGGHETENEGDCIDMVFLPSLDNFEPGTPYPFQDPHRRRRRRHRHLDDIDGRRFFPRMGQVHEPPTQTNQSDSRQDPDRCVAQGFCKLFQ